MLKVLEIEQLYDDNESILSVVFQGEEHNEFFKFFKATKNVSYLNQFFDDHKNELDNWNGRDGSKYSVEGAVSLTLSEAASFRTLLLKADDGNDIDLEDIFIPLHNNEYGINLIKSKARGEDGKSWLRLYGIRLDYNVYVITGGTIKLSQTMQEHEYLMYEIKKLEATIEFLKEHGIVDANDL